MCKTLSISLRLSSFLCPMLGSGQAIKRWPHRRSSDIRLRIVDSWYKYATTMQRNNNSMWSRVSCSCRKWNLLAKNLFDMSMKLYSAHLIHHIGLRPMWWIIHHSSQHDEDQLFDFKDEDFLRNRCVYQMCYLRNRCVIRQSTCQSHKDGMNQAFACFIPESQCSLSEWIKKSRKRLSLPEHIIRWFTSSSPSSPAGEENPRHRQQEICYSFKATHEFDGAKVDDATPEPPQTSARSVA
jgi:hypothetical protein